MLTRCYESSGNPATGLAHVLQSHVRAILCALLFGMQNLRGDLKRWQLIMGHRIEKRSGGIFLAEDIQIRTLDSRQSSQNNSVSIMARPKFEMVVYWQFR